MTNLLHDLRGKVHRAAPPEAPTVAEIFWAGCLYAINCTIVAVLYRQCLHRTPPEVEEKLDGHPSQIEEQKATDGFDFPLVGCEKCSLQLALCSMFCMCIRWPATVSNE